MAWADRLTDENLHAYYWLKIEGIPQVFTSMALPSGWFTGGRSQVSLLDVSGGLAIPVHKLNRKAGAQQPTNLSLRIGPDDATGTLRNLFAIQKASGNQTVLTSTLDWTEVVAANVVATAGFSATGYIYAGRETIYYDALIAFQFQTLTRGMFDSVAWKYEIDADKTIRTRRITDYPSIWEGRWCSLWCGFANASGQPLDDSSGLEGPDQREIWRGTINAINPIADFKSWQIDSRSIDGILDTEVGSYQAEGKLHFSMVNIIGPYTEGPQADLSEFGKQMFIQDGQDEVFLQVKRSGATSYTDVVFNMLTYNPSGLSADIWKDVAEAMDTELEAAFVADDFWVHTMGTSGSIEDIALMGFKVHCDGGPGGTPWEVNFVVDGNSIFRSMGFKTGVHVGSPDYITGLVTMEFLLYADEYTPALYLSPLATQILLFETKGQYNIQFPSSGYAILTADEGRAEVVKYTGVTEVYTDAHRIIRLTGVTRGHCGTQPLEVYLKTSGIDESGFTIGIEGERPGIKSCIAFENENLTSIMLKLALSTGSAALRDATYDDSQFPDYVGAGFDASHFDIDGFEYWGATTNYGGIMERNLAFSKPFRLRDFFSKELAAMGLTVLSKQSLGGYQISLARVREPLVVGQHTLTSADIVPESYPSIDSRLSDTINRIVVKARWNPAKEKFADDDQFIVNAIDAQVDYGTTNTLELQVKGLPNVDGAIFHALKKVGTGILAHFATRYEVVKVPTTKRVWAWNAGDQITVTLPDIPQWDGTQGFVSEPMILLGADQRHAQKGRGDLSVLYLLNLPARKVSYYVPCASGTGVTGALTITFHPNVYSDVNVASPITSAAPHDLDWFADGMVVYLRRPGDEGTFDVTRTIAAGGINLVTGVVTFTAGPPMWWAADDVMCYPDYANANAAQKQYVYIADNTALIGAGNDDAFRYGT